MTQQAEDGTPLTIHRRTPQQQEPIVDYLAGGTGENWLRRFHEPVFDDAQVRQDSPGNYNFEVDKGQRAAMKNTNIKHLHSKTNFLDPGTEDSPFQLAAEW